MIIPEEIANKKNHYFIIIYYVKELIKLLQLSFFLFYQRDILFLYLALLFAFFANLLQIINKMIYVYNNSKKRKEINIYFSEAAAASLYLAVF